MKNWKFVRTENTAHSDKVEVIKRLLAGGWSVQDIYDQLKTEGYEVEKNFIEKLKTGNESIDKQTWSMFKGLAKDAEKEVGNEGNTVKISLFKSPANHSWVPGINDHMIEGAPEFKGAWGKDEALKWTKEWAEKHGLKVGNDNTVSEYNAEIQRLTKKAEQLRRMGQGRSAMEVEKQIEKLGKELRELGNKKVGNAWTSADEKRLDELARKKATQLSDQEWKELQELIKRSEQASKDFFKKTGNARPKEQLLADVRELTKYIQDHPGQSCEKEKRLLGEAKEELDKNYGIIVGNFKTGKSKLSIGDKVSLYGVKGTVKSIIGENGDNIYGEPVIEFESEDGKTKQIPEHYLVKVGNTGHWDSKKMIYSKWDDEKGRPSDEYARITWLGEGKGGLAVVWRGTSMTGVKYGSNDLEDLRRWAEEKIGNETLAEYAKSKPRVINNLKRARNAMTKNAMGIADLEAQIKKNEEYIKSLQGKTVDSEGWSAKASIREAQDEIDRMKSRIADLKEQGNKKVGNLDTVEEGDYVTVRFQGELVDGVVRKVQGTQALVTIDNTDVWFPIRSLKESM